MTREQILNMKPGRELEALVADKVMGACRHDWQTEGPNVWNLGCSKCGEKYSGFSRKPPVIGAKDQDYSTDISAAWEVVEKLSIDWSVQIFNRNGWTCYISNNLSLGYNFKVFGDTAPEAICKAALLALEGEQK